MLVETEWRGGSLGPHTSTQSEGAMVTPKFPPQARVYRGFCQSLSLQIAACCQGLEVPASVLRGADKKSPRWVFTANTKACACRRISSASCSVGRKSGP